MGCDRASRAGAVLAIDLAGIAANWRLLRDRVAPAACAAVVKADAYGLGAAKVGPALAAAGCRLFFVATLDEGIALRRLLPEPIEIAVLNGPPPGTIGDFAAHRLIPVLNDPGQIEAWERFSLSALAGGEGGDPSRGDGEGEVGIGRRSGIPHLTPALSAPGGGEGDRALLPAMLHLDTGMARLGLSAREFEALADGLARRPWRAFLSHLACADASDHPLNEIQRTRFAAARRCLAAAPASLSASSGIFLGPAFHFDLVRPGAALYGVNPRPEAANPMRQVVHLTARILQVREIDRGESVGYGAAHRMDAPGRLATVAIGYADGWLRAFSHRGCGRVGGVRVPLVGRVSMDLASFDVTAADPSLARPGGYIDLLDEAYGVDAAAHDAGTIGYEILTALGRRYHRVYRGAARG